MNKFDRILITQLTYTSDQWLLFIRMKRSNEKVSTVCDAAQNVIKLYMLLTPEVVAIQMENRQLKLIAFVKWRFSTHYIQFSWWLTLNKCHKMPFALCSNWKILQLLILFEFFFFSISRCAILWRMNLTIYFWKMFDFERLHSINWINFDYMKQPNFLRCLTFKDFLWKYL